MTSMTDSNKQIALLHILNQFRDQIAPLGSSIHGPEHEVYRTLFNCVTTLQKKIAKKVELDEPLSNGTMGLQGKSRRKEKKINENNDVS